MKRLVRECRRNSGTLALSCLLILSACATKPDGALTSPVSDPTPVECPVLESRGWSAWINAMPTVGGGKSLHIAGEVDLPTPGYSVEVIPGPADRAMPPAQRFSLVVTPPDGMVAQVITPTEVKFDGKADYDAYRSIIIGCGGKVLAEITEIPTVH